MLCDPERPTCIGIPLPGPLSLTITDQNGYEQPTRKTPTKEGLGGHARQKAKPFTMGSMRWEEGEEEEEEEDRDHINVD